MGKVYKIDDYQEYESVPLSNDEQNMLVIEILKLKKIRGYIKHRDYYSKTTHSKDEDKWYNKLTPEELVEFSKYINMSEQEINDIKSEITPKENDYNLLLWNSIIGIVLKQLQLNYKHYVNNPETKSVLINYAWEELFSQLHNYDFETTFNTFVTRNILQGGNTLKSEQDKTTKRKGYYSKRVKEAIDNLKKEGREPDAAIIAEITNLPYKTVTDIMLSLNINKNTLSIDEMIKGTETLSDNDLSLDETKSYASPEESYLARELKDTIINGINKLDTLSSKIFNYVSGYGGVKKEPKEIATILCISEEEVLQRYETSRRTLKRLLSKEAIIKDSLVKEKAEKYNRMISFIPTNVSQVDQEDALFFMENNNFEVI